MLQPHLNAATVIRRVANRHNRRPETKAAMTLAAALLVSAKVDVEWNLIVDGEPYLQPWADDEALARECLNWTDGTVVNRIRITVPPMVEDWTSLPDPTAEESA
jgi:hypothetical protein